MMLKVLDVCDMEVGMFDNIEDFVRRHFYTESDHEEWLKESKEDDENFDIENNPYEESIQFYITTILNEKEIVVIEDRNNIYSGFEWGGYAFIEIFD